MNGENQAWSSSIVGRTFTMCGTGTGCVNIHVMQCAQNK